MATVAYVLTESGCWEWVGSRWPDGRYGRAYVGQGRRIGAHRYVYELMRGPIPGGMQINHLCENTICVRPDHLEVATPRANTLYSDTPARRNVEKTHCPRGHAYAESAFYSPPDSSRRRCRACHNTWRERAAARTNTGGQ